MRVNLPFRLVTSNLIAILLLIGFSCKQDDNIKQPRSPFENLSPQQAAAFLREDVRLRATTNPSSGLAAIISFQVPISGKKLLDLVEPSNIYVEQIRSDEIGIGNVSQTDKIGTFLSDAFIFAETSLMRSIAQGEQECQAGLSTCNREELIANQKSLSELRARGDITISAIGVNGTAKSLYEFTQQHSEIFSIVTETDEHFTILPLYPNTNMKEWR